MWILSGEDILKQMGTNDKRGVRGTMSKRSRRCSDEINKANQSGVLVKYKDFSEHSGVF